MADLSKSQQDTHRRKRKWRDGPAANAFAMAMSSGWYGLRPRTSPAGARRTREAGSRSWHPYVERHRRAAKKSAFLTSIDQHPAIDIYRRADEIDPHLNLIKGGSGRCCARSRGAASKRWWFIATPASWCRDSANFRCRWKLIHCAGGGREEDRWLERPSNGARELMAVLPYGQWQSDSRLQLWKDCDPVRCACIDNVPALWNRAVHRLASVALSEGDSSRSP